MDVLRWIAQKRVPFGIVLVLVVVLRPRSAGVFCSGKSPIVQIVKHQDFSRTKDDDEHEDELNFGIRV